MTQDAATVLPLSHFRCFQTHILVQCLAVRSQKHCTAHTKTHIVIEEVYLIMHRLRVQIRSQYGNQQLLYLLTSIACV